MAMAESVEVRVPFLDIEYVKLVESVPAKFKVNEFKIKYIHKINEKKFLPEKNGFIDPMAKWFINHFNDDLNKMVNDENFIIIMYLNIDFVIKMFANHRSGRSDYKHHLSLIYSLNALYKTFFD